MGEYHHCAGTRGDEREASGTGPRYTLHDPQHQQAGLAGYFAPIFGTQRPELVDACILMADLLEAGSGALEKNDEVLMAVVAQKSRTYDSGPLLLEIDREKKHATVVTVTVTASG